MSERWEGGCLCGRLRYEVQGGPKGDVGHCHCSMCRRASGAPVVTWFTIDKDRFRWTQGEPTVFKSSAKGTRTFCGRCGSPITFHHTDYAADLDVTVCSLDRPEDMPPTLQIWTGNRLPWLHLDEHLPQREGGLDSGA